MRPTPNLLFPDRRLAVPMWGLPPARRPLPRRRPRMPWRRPRGIYAPRRPDLRMFAGDTLTKDNGDWVVDEQGNLKVAKEGECPRCCGVCTECQTSPAVVTFSGVVACWTGCSGKYSWHNGASLEGTYTLTHRPDLVSAFYNCVYRFEGTGPVAVTLHKDLGCAGNTCFEDSVVLWNDLTIDLSRSATSGAWFLEANNVGAGSSFRGDLFQADGFYPPNCIDGSDPNCDQYCWTKTVGNTNDCGTFNVDSYCNEGFFDVLNHGGTATITVGGQA